ncbi:SCO2400 family protein [Streptomyces sp. HUAS TT7]|uniref:SCO2400 family protein n=1 Tax=Streptomyces sp. HUAS TT7 TaxID=3447507 RepID=UPI003F6569C2
MDYCHSCRRHLNGALACAGCGTPAEALAPAPEDELLVYAGRPPSRRAEVFVPSGHRRARKGRRARRKRGKVILFGSAGLVLAAGAVGFVQMAMEPPPGDDRASAVREDQTISDPQPLPSGSAAGVPSRPTARPVSSRGRGSGAASGKPGPGEAGPGAPGPVESGPHRSAPPRASATPDPGASGAVPSAPSSPGGPGAPAPSAPPSKSPDPAPPKPCKPFLFWCI